MSEIVKTSAEDVLATKLFFQAAFTAMAIPLNEDPFFVKKFKNINVVVQFSVDDPDYAMACHMVFMDEATAEASESKKRFKVYQGEYEGDMKVIKLHFKSIKSLLGVFKGTKMTDQLGIVMPVLKNLNKKETIPFILLMLTLTKMMPSYNPNIGDPFGQYLKVKMSLYMITTAMSRANKDGWEPMAKWTLKQTDRIYQFKVGATCDNAGNEVYPAIACYLRVKGGKSKAGRGVYTRKRPFVLLEFPSPEGCLAVLNQKYDFVEAVEHGCVTVVGSGDNYAVQFNDMMSKLQAILQP